MHLTEHLGKHLRDVHFGGNWTTTNLRDTLADVTWREATTQVQSFNTIATLAYHIHYFIDVVLGVLRGGPLDGNDTYSFDHPPIDSQEEWENFLNKTWEDAESFALLIASMPESRLWEDFVDPKYGNYFRNIQGIIEHTHYHLGQIVLLKVLVRTGAQEAEPPDTVASSLPS